MKVRTVVLLVFFGLLLVAAAAGKIASLLGGCPRARRPGLAQGRAGPDSAQTLAAAAQKLNRGEQ